MFMLCGDNLLILDCTSDKDANVWFDLVSITVVELSVQVHHRQIITLFATLPAIDTHYLIIWIRDLRTPRATQQLILLAINLFQYLIIWITDPNRAWAEWKLTGQFISPGDFPVQWITSNPYVPWGVRINML